jgi:ketosteroid isomerase-like protein
VSQENVELVKEAIEAVARQDAARLVELTDPEVEWRSFLAQLGEGGVYRGHDGIRRYVSDLSEALDFLRTEVDDVLVSGDVVVVVGRLRFRGKGSGVETEAPAGYVARFSGGRIAFMRAFREPEQALLAVGLTE